MSSSGAPTRRTGMRERNVSVYLMLILAACMAGGPLLVVLLNSLRSDAEITGEPLGLPSSLGGENYVRAWSEASVGQYMWNSVLVTAGAMLLGLAVSLPVAYAIARWRFAGRGVVTVFFLSGLMIPMRIGVLPLYHMFESAGLSDTRVGLVLVYAATGMPMAVLLLSTFYRRLPDTLGDAAMIDGAGHFTLFWRIYTPLIKPAVATVVVLNIGPAWNDFFFPLIMQRTQRLFTLPVGITAFFSEFSVDRGLLFAGLVLAAAPLAIVFALSMRFVVGGLTAGMEK